MEPAILIYMYPLWIRLVFAALHEIWFMQKSTSPRTHFLGFDLFTKSWLLLVAYFSDWLLSDASFISTKYFTDIIYSVRTFVMNFLRLISSGFRSISCFLHGPIAASRVLWAYRCTLWGEFLFVFSWKNTTTRNKMCILALAQLISSRRPKKAIYTSSHEFCMPCLR